MKDFLKLRDADKAFARIRRSGRIGLPTVVADGKVFHNLTDEVIAWIKGE